MVDSRRTNAEDELVRVTGRGLAEPDACVFFPVGDGIFHREDVVLL